MKGPVAERRYVLGLLCALGVASNPLARATAAVPPACTAGLADGIGATALRELAAEVRARYPRETDTRVLTTLLRDQTSGDAIARLRERVVSDYGDGRLVEVAGWRISRTEATLFVALGECV